MSNLLSNANILIDKSKIIGKEGIKIDVANFIHNTINNQQIKELQPNIAALNLGENEKYIEGLQKFQDQVRSFFWSSNFKLEGSTSKPKQVIDTVAQWDKLFTNKQINVRITLLELADLDENTPITSNNIDKITKAYNSWPLEFYAIFQQLPTGGDSTTYTCNIFVGESLFLSGLTILNVKKYYSAASIFKGQHPGLKEVYPKISQGEDKKWDTKDDVCQVKVGDVWAKEGNHLEIVTKIMEKDGIFFPFCSRGAGRYSDQGTETCEKSKRKVNLSINKFFRIK